MGKKPRLTEEQKISIEDWEKTPIAVKELVVQLSEKIEQLEQKLRELEKSNQELTEKVNRNSKNSNSSPSSDWPQVEKKKSKKTRGKKRGGQPGHQGHRRELYPIEECEKVINYYPSRCKCCGEELIGEDKTPYRHQVVEIPPIKLQIEEHRLHQRQCSHCGAKTRAQLPESVTKSGYGERVTAIVALLNGMYHHSHRMIRTAMRDLFGVRIGLGTVNRLRKEVSNSVAPAVESAHSYIQSATEVGADETGFKQGNGDGKNPQQTKAWLWVGVTKLVSYFQVTLSRSQEAAKSLLGEKFQGILNSDRYGAYNWLDVHQRQLCWAHLKREFIKIAQRNGISRQIGRDLLAQQKKLFRLWRRVRDGTLSWSSFQSLVKPHREKVKSLLDSTAEYEIGTQEKTPLAKTVRTCRQLLKVEPALWLFTSVKGIEPTNNAAERAIRPAVLWRKNSFGSQSEEGSLFVARMLTVVTSLRAQNRNVLAFLTESIRASRQGSSSPSLLPV